MLSMGMSRPERILVLNYNTLFFQSVGFLTTMLQTGFEHKLYSQLDPSGHSYLLARTPERNTAALLDPSTTEAEYHQFIKRHYNKVTKISPQTSLSAILQITSGQSFVEKVFVASYSPLSFFEKETPFFDHVQFDIFDATQVETFIKENGITFVFLHDIHMVRDIVFNFNIDLYAMTFVVSKLGYNFEIRSGEEKSKCQEVFDLANEMEFNVAFINLYDNTRGVLDNEF